ncbi:MAG: hypothetical protein WBD41_17795 [Rhodococcus sp. (in: high G+C Gram-positive bacteria)]
MTAVMSEVSTTASEAARAALLPGDGSFVTVRTESGGVSVAGWLMVDHGVRESLSQSGGEAEVLLFGLDETVRFVSVVPALVSAVDMPTVRELDSLRRYLLRQLVAERAAMRSESGKVRAEVERTRAAAAEEFARRLDSITDAAHEYADDNDLCSVFDDFMESQGLRTREKDFCVEIDAAVSVRVYLTRTDRDGDGARDQIDRSDVHHAVAESLGVSFDSIDVSGYDVADVNVA